MCEVDLYGEERATIWNVTHPRARREHRCDCCGGAIEPGEHYAVTRCLYDGHWTTEKSCFGCATIINAFGEEHRFYPSASSFREFLSECARWDEESRRRWDPAVAFIESRLSAARKAAGASTPQPPGETA